MGKIVIYNCDRFCRRKPRKPKVYFTFWTGPQSFFNVLANRKGGLPMAIMTNEEVFPNVTITPLTGKGNPAPIDGAVVWTSSDESVATVTPNDPNGLSATVAAVGVGVCEITAVCDADMDPGEERHITGVGPLSVVAAEAQTVEINFGAPQ